MVEPVYDSIGLGYSSLRQTEPRIARFINKALGEAQSVVNIGAGTGSYEPSDRHVLAVEPSAEMIRQRSKDMPDCIRASAEKLPLNDSSFDAAMAVLTIHHWSDPAKGLMEMQRVARDRVVLLTFDPEQRPWLTDYLPELAAFDEQKMPSMDCYADWLGAVEITPVPIPYDCIDGFLYAYWRRPEAYLSPALRAGSSSFALLAEYDDGLARLESDLASGAWHAKYSAIAALDEYDAGYRLVVAEL